MRLVFFFFFVIVNGKKLYTYYCFKLLFETPNCEAHTHLRVLCFTFYWHGLEHNFRRGGGMEKGGGVARGKAEITSFMDEKCFFFFLVRKTFV